MKLVSLILLLFFLHYVYCQIEEEKVPPPTDIVGTTAHKKKPAAAAASNNNNNLGSMWTAVRQRLGNLNFNNNNNNIPAVASVAVSPPPPPPPATKNETSTSSSIKEQGENLDIEQEKEDTSLNQEDKSPSQMAPIEKALIYTRPKPNERWILKEEGLITWAISSYLDSTKADSIYMNCNLYLDGKMILSVFKGVPLTVGTESWTPPVFLESSPNYRLRMWSQPSQIGIIDEYSAPFSIVPRKQDAFMFSYNKSILFDTSNNNNTGLIPTAKMRVGNNDFPSPSEKHGIVIDVNSKPTIPSSLNSNLPTGIYALYPSSGHRSRYNSSNNGIWIASIIIVLFATFTTL